MNKNIIHNIHHYYDVMREMAMRTQGDKNLENKFRHILDEIQGYNERNLSIKASLGLVTFRGVISSKALRLKIVEAALEVMDEALGKGHQRIAGNPR